MDADSVWDENVSTFWAIVLGWGLGMMTAPVVVLGVFFLLGWHLGPDGARQR